MSTSLEAGQASGLPCRQELSFHWSQSGSSVSGLLICGHKLNAWSVMMNPQLIKSVAVGVAPIRVSGWSKSCISAAGLERRW